MVVDLFERECGRQFDPEGLPSYCWIIYQSFVAIRTLTQIVPIPESAALAAALNKPTVRDFSLSWGELNHFSRHSFYATYSISFLYICAWD